MSFLTFNAYIITVIIWWWYAYADCIQVIHNLNCQRCYIQIRTVHSEMLNGLLCILFCLSIHICIHTWIIYIFFNLFSWKEYKAAVHVLSVLYTEQFLGCDCYLIRLGQKKHMNACSVWCIIMIITMCIMYIRICMFVSMGMSMSIM